VLRPEVGGAIAATHAQWNVVINFKVPAAH
jgi:hypothetical protein